MSDFKAVERLCALGIDLDLEVSHQGQTFHLRGQGKRYELVFSSWRSLLKFLKSLRNGRVGWRELRQTRTILKASGRRLGVTVKGYQRFSFGA